MASGLLIKQKQLLAGDGITIEHAQTSSTISLSNSTLNAAVRIYDATIASDTGVVTITDGTPVADLNIGDEIRTPDGVYQKTKDSITSGGDPATGDIQVSGMETPASANGTYVYQSENLWKNETTGYWFDLLFNQFWRCTSTPDIPTQSASVFYSKSMSSGIVMPWEIPASDWYVSGSWSGTPVVESLAGQQTVTNTIDLFEYASTSVASADIVQSVNGNKPDTEGNVTIEIPQAGLESVTTGDGLTGNGTAGDPITLDLSNYVVSSNIVIRASGPYSLEVKKGSFGLTASDTETVLSSVGYSIALDVFGIRYQNSYQNTAGGLAVVGSNGKLPDSILPTYVKSVNNVNPDSSGNVTIDLPDGGLTSVSVGNGLTGNGTSSSPIKLDLSNAVMEHNCAINAQGNTFTVGNLNTASIQTTDIELSVSNEFSLNFPGHNTNITINDSSISIQTTAIRLNGCSQNTAGGFAIVGEDGKLPSSIIPVSSNRHPFTSSDLSSNVLTITTTGNVTGVIDDSGKAWNFADEEVTYTDSTVSVDLSGVFARKGIATPTGTWKLMLYGA